LGVYRATDLSLGLPDAWPGAPPGPYFANLADFHAEDPNGSWSLHVVDDQGPFPFGAGKIQGGWSLGIETADPDVLIPGSGTSGPADPYPATRTVSGMTGVITDANVFLGGVGHRRPDNLDILLVGPRGQKVTLMSDTCGEPDAEFALWAFDDEAPAAMPDGGGGDMCPTGIYRPTDHEPGEGLPAPAPPGPYATSLSAFDFTDPNGEWRLFVSDDSAGEDGWIVDPNQTSTPFFLQLTTRPRAQVAFGESSACSPRARRRSSRSPAPGRPSWAPGRSP